LVENGRFSAEQVGGCFKMPFNLSGAAIIEFTVRDEGNVTDIELVNTGRLVDYLVGLVAVNAVKSCRAHKTSITGRVCVPFILRAEDC